MIAFDVVGLPMPKGSKTVFNNKKFAKSVEAVKHWVAEGGSKARRSEMKAWSAAVRVHAQAYMNVHQLAALDGPIVIEVWFYMPRPKSAPKRIVFPIRKPDLDKLTRSVLDSCSTVCYVDDARAIELHIYKRFAMKEPYAHICISPADGAALSHDTALPREEAYAS